MDEMNGSRNTLRDFFFKIANLIRLEVQGSAI